MRVPSPPEAPAMSALPVQSAAPPASTVSGTAVRVASSASPAWFKAVRVLLSLIAVGIAWEAAVVIFSIKPHYLPRLSLVLQAIAATPDAYVSGFLRTLAESLIGFASGA